MNKELNSVELARIEFEKNLEEDPNNEWLKRLITGLKMAEQSLRRLEAIDNANPSEALKGLKHIKKYYVPQPCSCRTYDYLEIIEQVLLKEQEIGEENAKYKSVLDALKIHLHILSMSNGDDVIGIGCPSNEDVIEPNDFGYDIIKEWLEDDECK